MRVHVDGFILCGISFVMRSLWLLLFPFSFVLLNEIRDNYDRCGFNHAMLNCIETNVLPIDFISALFSLNGVR